MTSSTLKPVSDVLSARMGSIRDSGKVSPISRLRGRVPSWLYPKVSCRNVILERVTAEGVQMQEKPRQGSCRGSPVVLCLT